MWNRCQPFASAASSFRPSFSLGRILFLSHLLVTSPAWAQIQINSVSPGELSAPRGQWSRLQTVIPARLPVRVGPNASASITLTQPEWVSGPSPDPEGTRYASELRWAEDRVEGGSLGKPLPVGETELSIWMEVERPIWYEAGDYQYQVLVTITNN